MSVGRWTPRRIASHHLACLARDASRARTTTTRMDDARDATVTIALNACFCAVRAPTAVARTASPSSSGSDARGNVAMVFRKGSGVTPMARVAVDECATLAAKGRCERNNKNVESLVLRLLMTTFNEKQKR